MRWYTALETIGNTLFLGDRSNSILYLQAWNPIDTRTLWDVAGFLPELLCIGNPAPSSAADTCGMGNYLIKKDSSIQPGSADVRIFFNGNFIDRGYSSFRTG